MVNWQRPTRHYAKRVEAPIVWVKTETLAKCRAGLSKHIRNTKDKSKKGRLKEIRDEIDFLIGGFIGAQSKVAELVDAERVNVRIRSVRLGCTATAFVASTVYGQPIMQVRILPLLQLSSAA